MMDNQALYNVERNKNGNPNLGNPKGKGSFSPSYCDINRLVGQVASSINFLNNPQFTNLSYFISKVIKGGGVKFLTPGLSFQSKSNNYEAVLLKEARSSNGRLLFNTPDDTPPGNFSLTCNNRPFFGNCEINPNLASCVTIDNSKIFAQALDKVLAKFDNLYQKRAYIHWFIGEGMEESEFDEARADLAKMRESYNETP